MPILTPLTLLYIQIHHAMRLHLFIGKSRIRIKMQTIYLCRASSLKAMLDQDLLPTVTALSGNVWAQPAAPGERCAKKDGPGSVVGFVAPVGRGPVLLELTAAQARAATSRAYGDWSCLAAQAAVVSMAVFLVLRAWFRRPLAPVAALLSPRIVVREPTPEVFRSSSTAAKRAATPAG